MPKNNPIPRCEAPVNTVLTEFELPPECIKCLFAGINDPDAVREISSVSDNPSLVDQIDELEAVSGDTHRTLERRRELDGEMMTLREWVSLTYVKPDAQNDNPENYVTVEDATVCVVSCLNKL